MFHEEITVETAKDEQSEEIQTLIGGVLGEYGLNMDPEGIDADLNNVASTYHRDGGRFYVLMRAGTLVGTVGLFSLNAEEVELRKMYFLQEIRGIGLGRKLLTLMIAEATTLGFKRMLLETHSSLVEAIGLYRSAGFTECKSLHKDRCDKAFVLDLSTFDGQTG